MARAAGKVSRGPRWGRTAALNVRMRDGGQDDVMLPTRITSPFEVVEAQFAFEFLVLLLDRPPLMRQAHHGRSDVVAGRCTK